MKSSIYFTACISGLALSLTTGCSLSTKRTVPQTAPQEAEVASPAPSIQAQPVVMEPSEYIHPWSYQGNAGPAHWAELNSEYIMCNAGRSQSPIDLRWKKPRSGGDLQFFYQPTRIRISDVGHTIQVNVDPGSYALIRGERYELSHIHFRSSSEHTLSSNSLPIEVQLFHKDPVGRLAVVSLFAIEGPTPHALVTQLWSRIPNSKNLEESFSNELIDPRDLIPDRLTYYHYNGSLTYPPCTEGVNWNVMNTPIHWSSDQILRFRKLYSTNNRPTQPTNDRQIVNY